MWEEVETHTVVFHAGAAGEENDDFLAGVAFEEGEEEEEAHIARTQHVALLQPIDCAVLLFVIDIDV